MDIVAIGDRVGAILSSDENEVHLLGYGKYLGDLDDNELGIPNPKIELDDGNIVWGYECWWGPEEDIKQRIGDRTVVEVDAAVHFL